MPNMVVMPAISFATKVKEMAAAEAAAKEKAAAEVLLQQEQAKKESFQQNLYASIYKHSNRSTAPQEDSWDTEGTPEFGREEFLNQDNQEDYEDETN
jgi:hypothetical protein